MPARLEVIAGPMFSGKSEELIRRIRRAKWANKRIALVKPFRDSRTESYVATRNIVDGRSLIAETFPAEPVCAIEDILMVLESTEAEILGIDEGQFFDDWLIDGVAVLLRTHKLQDFRIIVAGLDLDYRLQPFGPMPQLLAMADRIDKLTGVCMNCGTDDARFTQRLHGTSQTIQVGDLGDYQVRCRKCHFIPTLPK